MNSNSIDLAIHDILTNTKESGKHNQASFDFLLEQGDLVVPNVIREIEKYESGGKTGETSIDIRVAIELLAEIDSDLSKANLLKLLNTDWKSTKIYWDIIEALPRCSGSADLVEGLIQAANGPRARYIADLYLLVRKFDGHMPVSAEQAIKIVQNMPSTEEALQVIDDFAKEIPKWPSSSRCSFFWFYGIRVAAVKSDREALPYFAASVLANPGQAAAAWSKFPGTTPSASEAKKLAKKYPLPEPFNQPSSKKWWHF